MLSIQSNYITLRAFLESAAQLAEPSARVVHFATVNASVVDVWLAVDGEAMHKRGLIAGIRAMLREHWQPGIEMRLRVRANTWGFENADK